MFYISGINKQWYENNNNNKNKYKKNKNKKRHSINKEFKETD